MVATMVIAVGTQYAVITADDQDSSLTIVNEYEGRTPLFHFDMYRLGSSDELFDIGWDDYLARGGVCAVEWSERVSDALPEDTIFVDIARTGEHEDWRTITVTGGRFA